MRQPLGGRYPYESRAVDSASVKIMHNAFDRLTQPPRDGEVQPDAIRRLVELGLKAKPSK